MFMSRIPDNNTALREGFVYTYRQCHRLFKVMYEQHHGAALNPFLNGGFGSTSKRVSSFGRNLLTNTSPRL